MKKAENQNNVTVDPAILNYANPYFVPIEDGDEETIKHYRETMFRQLILLYREE